MGMQVSRGVDTEVSEEDIVFRVAKVFGFNIQRLRHTEGVPGDRRPSFARSHSHVDIGTAQIFGCKNCKLFERQKCHSDSQNLYGSEKNFTGQHFWARGYFVSTVGADEKTIRDYIRLQESEDRRLDFT